MASKNELTTASRRFLKIQSLQRYVNNYSTYCPKTHCISVPFLRLSGKWLQQAGFDIYSTVSVTVEERLLTIQPAEREGTLTHKQ